MPYALRYARAVLWFDQVIHIRLKNGFKGNTPANNFKVFYAVGIVESQNFIIGQEHWMGGAVLKKLTVVLMGA
jgi:hypothetical protein